MTGAFLDIEKCFNIPPEVFVPRPNVDSAFIKITKKANLEVWVKEMEGGVKAVGLFNRGTFENTLSIQWKDLGINGEQIVRDLWRQKDLGTFLNEFKVKLPRHSVMLVKLTPKEKNIPNL